MPSTCTTAGIRSAQPSRTRCVKSMNGEGIGPAWKGASARGRRTTNGPMASRSTGAEPKHSSASRGSSTIGRPAVFSDVLTTTGTPVRRSKASRQRAISGSASGFTVWIRAVPSTCTTAGIRSSQSR